MGKRIYQIFGLGLMMMIISLINQDVCAKTPGQFLVPPPPPPKAFGHPTPNIKLIPALMYSTVGLEFEYPTGRMSFGGTAFWKYGNGYGASSNTQRPEEYQELGYRIEAFGRYYFKDLAPIGFFGEAKVYYNDIMYWDGNPIPFTLYTQGRPENNGQPAEIKKPKPIGFGIGGGFQATIVPKIVIAYVKLGLEFNQDTYDNYLISLYFQPAIGYIF